MYDGVRVELWPLAAFLPFWARPLCFMWGHKPFVRVRVCCFFLLKLNSFHFRYLSNKPVYRHNTLSPTVSLISNSSKEPLKESRTPHVTHKLSQMDDGTKHIKRCKMSVVTHLVYWGCVMLPLLKCVLINVRLQDYEFAFTPAVNKTSWTRGVSIQLFIYVEF